MLINTDKLRNVRFYPDSKIVEYGYNKEGAIKYDFYGKTLDYSPQAVFVADYLYLKNNLNIEDTLYYHFLKDIHNASEIAKTNCFNYIEIIDSLEKFGQSSPISIFQVSQNVNIIMDGVHRSAYYFMTKQNIEFVYNGFICHYFEVSKEQTNKILELYKKIWIYLESDRMSYQPVWWITGTTENNKIIHQRRDTFGRINAILEDIVDVQGYKILEVGANSGCFSAAISQLPHTEVVAMDIFNEWCDIMKLRQDTTGLNWDIRCCELKNIDEEFDVTIYLDVFHEMLRTTGQNKVDNILRIESEFEQICRMTKRRIYICLGDPAVLKDSNHLSYYVYKILSKYGFDLRILYYNNCGYSEYRRILYVADKK